MRRIELGNPCTLENLRVVELDPPRPQPGEVLVKIAASSLNFHDYLVATGLRPCQPRRVPMSDGVGRVTEVGAGVTTLHIGDRVVGTFFADWLDGAPDDHNTQRMRGDHVDGFASEYVALPVESFTPAPSILDDLEVATLPCAALTAWRALFVEGGLQPGQRVLVQGTGGVSLFALQLARMAGARVIALSSREEKIGRLKALGADEVLNYRETPDWSKKVRALSDGGVDHVLEVVGGDLSQSLAACRTGGTIHLIGALSRKAIAFPAVLAITANVRIVAITVGSRRHQADMMAAIDVNGLKPVIDRTYAFMELAEAFRHQSSGAQFGKICVQW